MTLSAFTQSPLWLTAGWTMLHFCWVGSALGLLAVTGRWLLRSARPEHRYAFALACFFALAASPIVIAGWVVRNLPVGSVPAEHSLAKSEPIPLEPHDLPRAVPEMFPADDSLGTAVIDSAPKADQGAEKPSFAVQTVRYLPWFWLAGTPVTLLALATGLIGVERMRRRSQIIDSCALQERCRRLAASLGIARRIAVGVCERLTTPILVGIFRPLILLPPAALAGWSAEELEMVLLHELIHVRRWDPLINLLQRTVEALLFFHPVVWWVSGWLRLERELCCDQIVIRHTGRPQAYAGMLAALAMPSPGVRGVALAMSENHLVTRIRHILKVEDRSMRLSSKALILAIALTIAAVASLGLYTQKTKLSAAFAGDPAPATNKGEEQKNFWTDPVTHNQYFVGVQTPEPPAPKGDEAKQPKAPANTGVPKLPKGTLPSITLPIDQPLPMGKTVSLPGEVEAFEHVDLYAGVAGFIKRLNVDIGDRVKKGDVLAELDVPDLEGDYKQKLAVVAQGHAELEVTRRAAQSARVAADTSKLQVQEAEAALKSAQANFNYRKSQMERMKSLLESKAIDQAVLDEATSRFEAAKSALEAAEVKVRAAKSAVEEVQAQYAKAEATVKVAEAKLAVTQADAQRSAALMQFAKVRAPFDGVITQRNFFAGDFAQAAGGGKMQPLLVVARTDVVRVIIHVPDSDVTRISVGIPATVRLDALKGVEFKGKVARIAGAIDSKNRTLRAEIDLPNSEGKILPGMFGTVTLIVEK